MSRRRRSRFTTWAVGGDPDHDDSVTADNAVTTDDAVNPDETLAPSLSDLLVGDAPPDENPPESATTPPQPARSELPFDGHMIMVPIEAVSPNTGQPRRRFEESALAALSASIAELGVLQPIIVRPGVLDLDALDDDPAAAPTAGSYELIAGERRWRAARRAGLTHIPALVRQVDDLRSLEEAIVENLHRVDLNPLEEANAFQQLIDDFGLTQEDVATRVGKSRPAVANTLRLLQLPGSLQRMVVDGELSAGHARALLAEPNLARQRELADRMISDGLSVRQAEELMREQGEHSGGARKPSDTSSRKSGSRKPKSAGALEVENHLSDLLDTRVRVSERARSGSITIEFADDEDLDRIYRLFVGPSRRRSSSTDPD